MAMSEAAKKRVPKSKRGVPGKTGTGSYPMETAKERGEAKSMAAMNHGKNSAFTKRIDAKADRLGGDKTERDEKGRFRKPRAGRPTHAHKTHEERRAERHRDLAKHHKAKAKEHESKARELSRR